MQLKYFIFLSFYKAIFVAALSGLLSQVSARDVPQVSLNVSMMVLGEDRVLLHSENSKRRLYVGRDSFSRFIHYQGPEKVLLQGTIYDEEGNETVQPLGVAKFPQGAENALILFLRQNDGPYPFRLIVIEDSFTMYEPGMLVFNFTLENVGVKIGDKKYIIAAGRKEHILGNNHDPSEMVKMARVINNEISLFHTFTWIPRDSYRSLVFITKSTRFQGWLAVRVVHQPITQELANIPKDRERG